MENSKAGTKVVNIPCSQEQIEIIIDHLAYGSELGMERDEKIWILNHVHKNYPGSKVLGANLNQGELLWEVTITVP